MQTDPGKIVDPQELMVFRHLGARLPYTNLLRQYEVRLTRVELQSRISTAMSRAAAAASRLIDPRVPLTWEFAGFSQHGEAYLTISATTFLNQTGSFSKSGRRTESRTIPLGWHLPEGTAACGWTVTQRCARTLDSPLRE